MNISNGLAGTLLLRAEGVEAPHPERRGYVARETGNLKVKQVDKLLRAGVPANHYDGRGLRLEIKGPGNASWVSRYQIDGVERWMGIGSALTFNLVEARERNRILVRQRLADGVDPLLARRKERADRIAAAAKAAAKTMTFAAATAEYLAEHSSKWSNPKHAKQWSSTLETYAEPLIGAVPCADVDIAMVLGVLKQPVKAALGYPAGPLWSTRPETGARLRGRIESVLNFAKVNGYRDRASENPATLSLIKAALPARSDSEHHPAMHYGEVPAFMQTLRAREGVAERALEFLILCAARSQEALKATWSEIIFDEATWVVPAARMKKAKNQERREHRVPLSSAAVELLRGLYREGDGVDGYIFIGTKPGESLGHTALARLLERMGHSNITTHGFRSAFRTWVEEQTSHPEAVGEMALAHSVGDKVQQAYRRGNLFAKRSKLMEQWARFCASPPELKKKRGGSNVVNIGSAR